MKQQKEGGHAQTINEPLFELRTKSGDVYKIFENGRYEGFPKGTWIINRAKPLLDFLRCFARKKESDTSLVSKQTAY